MDSLTEIHNEINEDREPNLFAKPRAVSKKRNIYVDPLTVYDYCAIFSRITGKPIGLFLSQTKGYPLGWFHEMYSYLKTYRDNTGKAKYIWWFVREARAK